MQYGISHYFKLMFNIPYVSYFLDNIKIAQFSKNVAFGFCKYVCKMANNGFISLEL